MRKFLDEDFLLGTKTAYTLYHEYAKDMPIFDFHCHMSPAQIAGNTRFENLTQVWLYEDHYKWRAMRSNGVEEKYITGDASDFEKYTRWAETIPYTIGNPLYHWTHLELKRVFGIDDLLNPETALPIWNRCEELLQEDRFCAQALMEQMNVKVVCTTDDPADSLEHHIAIRNNESFNVKVLPCLRPDKALAAGAGPAYREYLERLGRAADLEIRSYSDLLEALERRHKFFHDQGCRLSDHDLGLPAYADASHSELDAIFVKGIAAAPITDEEIKKFKFALLVYLGCLNKKRDWTTQYHIGATRNNSTRLLNSFGPDAGCDAMGDGALAKPLAKLLDALDSTNELPRTILYNLNPRDNLLLAALMGCYQDSSVPSKIQLGSGWWFNDQKDGMIQQMTTFANLGLLSRFVGMLTDSRSFLSYCRHEYFRRILCDLIGGWVEAGEAPNDLNLLGKMVQDISFNNAKNYFRIPV